MCVCIHSMHVFSTLTKEIIGELYNCMHVHVVAQTSFAIHVRYGRRAEG